MWVYEWCISSQVCIVAVVYVCISDEPSVCGYIGLRFVSCLLFVTEVTIPNDWSVSSVKKFDSTTLAFVRSRASQAAGSYGRLAQKTESDPHFWGHGLCRHNLCRCLQQSNLVQAAPSWTTTYPSSPQSEYNRTTDYNKTDGLSPTTRKPTGQNSRKTQSPLSLRPTYTLPT